MRLTIELYGRLRDAGLGSSIELETPKELRAQDLLSLLAATLGEKASMLEGAVLATESRILFHKESIPSKETRLAVLPPVSGG